MTPAAVKEFISKNTWPSRYEPEEWNDVRTTTNCYAYALNSMVPSSSTLEDSIYFPGALAKFEWKETLTKEDILLRVKSDLKLIGRECRESSFKESVPKGRQKICVLWSKHDKDFHFLRLDEDGKWSHKDGWSAIPSQKDYWKRFIYDPRKAFFGRYRFVAFLII